jgi:hypothetical protein
MLPAGLCSWIYRSRRGDEEVNPIIRQVTGDTDRVLCCQLAESWGYPRPITQVEKDEAAWFRDECGTGILWFMRIEDTDYVQVHGIGNPEARKRGQVMTPWVVTAIRVIGGIMGAKRIYSPLPEIPGFEDATRAFPAKAIRRYLQHAGWDGEDELGPYISLELEEKEDGN